MGEGPKDSAATTANTRISTPETAQQPTGNPAATHGVNTNLSPDMQGGPTHPADRAAVQDIQERHQGDPFGE